MYFCKKFTTMKLNIGDKVRFLNDEGGGFVSKIISTKMVNVTIEDGFEIPTLTSELLKIEPDNISHRTFSDHPTTIDLQADTTENFVEKASSLKKYSYKRAVAPGIYLAFVPQDQKWLITGTLDIYLINQTVYDILFSLFLKDEDGGYSGIDYDSIGPESKLLLQSINREDTDRWTNGIIQILFHKDINEKIIPPSNSNFRITVSRFYKEDNYTEVSILEERAFLISIVEMPEVISNISIGKEAEKEEPVEIIETEAREVKEETIIDQHIINPDEVEVDLHIEALVDDPSTMHNKEKLDYQLNYFKNCLEDAMDNQLSRVVFIHGEGKGVLKTEILKTLKSYDNVHYFDASRARYGVGAIEVLIKRKG